MPYFLESLDGQQRFNLSGPEEVYLVGRSEECDIRLDSRKVSRRHCCLAQVNDYLAVRDLASTNGIRINDREVLEGRLYNGDILTIGPYRFRVTWLPEDAVPSGPVRKTSSPASAPPRVAPVPVTPAASPAPSNAPAVGQTPAHSAKPGSILEDSRLFKMLESEDPLLGGQR